MLTAENLERVAKFEETYGEGDRKPKRTAPLVEGNEPGFTIFRPRIDKGTGSLVTEPIKE